jgi:hypothetical protein
VSADNAVESPETWTGPYFGPEIGQHIEAVTAPRTWLSPGTEPGQRLGRGLGTARTGWPGGLLGSVLHGYLAASSITLITVPGPAR